MVVYSKTGGRTDVSQRVSLACTSVTTPAGQSDREGFTWVQLTESGHGYSSGEKYRVPDNQITED